MSALGIIGLTALAIVGTFLGFCFLAGFSLLIGMAFR